MAFQEMDIRLGGFNVDYDVLMAIIKGDIKPEDAVLTPESIAAAYARVSRSNKPLHELRQEAVTDIAATRKSIEKIDHGMGHKSIADHVYFNLDLNFISRLAVELVERHRLAGYTERSQRFVLFKDDFLIPPEIKSIGLANEFIKLYKFMFQTYHEIFTVLRQYVLEKNSITDPSKLSEARLTSLENLAKEDARYVIGLAVQTSFGSSFNGQEIELVIRHLLSDSLQEGQTIGSSFKKLVQPIAPSLVKYCEPVEFFKNLPAIIRSIGARYQGRMIGSRSYQRINSFWSSKEPDDVVVAAILCEGNVGSLNDCYKLAQTMPVLEKSAIILKVLQERTIHDNVTRHFEMAEFTFDTIGSASLYAQLKRHRITTQIPGDYVLDYGITTPQSFIDCNLTDKLVQVVEAAEGLYKVILAKTGNQFLATYALTNAHRRRILVKMNLREAYHYAKERCASFAQWDIQETANQMMALVLSKAPISGQLMCGKDCYDSVKAERYQ